MEMKKKIHPVLHHNKHILCFYLPAFFPSHTHKHGVYRVVIIAESLILPCSLVYHFFKFLHSFSNYNVNDPIIFHGVDVLQSTSYLLNKMESFFKVHLPHLWEAVRGHPRPGRLFPPLNTRAFSLFSS